MSHLGRNEVEFADAALILLEGRDLPRVGRPGGDRAVAHRPAGVVRGVAEILHPVGGELYLAFGCNIAQTHKFPIANEGRALAVR